MGIGQSGIHTPAQPSGCLSQIGFGIIAVCAWTIFKVLELCGKRRGKK